MLPSSKSVLGWKKAGHNTCLQAKHQLGRVPLAPRLIALAKASTAVNAAAPSTLQHQPSISPASAPQSAPPAPSPPSPCTRCPSSAPHLQLVNGLTIQMTGRSVSPLVLSYPTSAGPLYIGIDGPIQDNHPGNGGLRIWKYASEQDAVAECRVLASTMTLKHRVYNTGFSGAKLVLNATNAIAGINKAALMAEVSDILHELCGTVYTGCDLNTSMEDMEILTELCPYVLASVGCLTDANDATGFGVYASIEGAAEELGGLEGRTCLVLGCGKVGSIVAKLLAQAGAKVLTYDIYHDRADIPGCTNVSGQDWRSIPTDILSPCSTSGFIDTHTAAMLHTKIVVGSSNAPFKDAAAQDVLETRGVIFVPESISSAGAVLADSIEQFDWEAYRTARPAYVHAYIHSLVKSKTRELLNKARLLSRVPSHMLEDVCTDPYTPPVGSFFSQYLEEHTQHFDVAVIGGGMAGTAASYWLSKLAPQMKGVVLESRTVAHKGGSSYGDSRMYRQMYSQEYFSRMQTAALQLWDELERESGVQLLTPNGLLFYGETDTGETVEGSVRGVAQTCKQLGLEHEYFADPEEMRKKWEQIRPGENYEGVYEAAAGSVNASLSCATMMGQALQRGWSLLENTRVEDIQVSEPGDVKILTHDGKLIKANKLVLCAGGWTNEVLRKMGHEEMALEVWNVHWGHYQVAPEVARNLPQWFCFQKDKADEGSWDGGLYYGFPPPDKDSSSPVIKVGIDFTPEDPKFRTEGMEGFAYEPDERVARYIDQFMKENWSGIGERRDMQASPYTMTKDSYFVLDKLPGRPEVCMFTGGNGRAFKFAPLIGRCLAELVLDLPPSYDLSPLSAKRAALKKGKEEMAAEAAAASSASQSSSNGIHASSNGSHHNGNGNGRHSYNGSATVSSGSSEAGEKLNV
ncbi:FAD dependent oxidoreductase-domain-containing protein [Dunaliella salina]|uniref:FAD dependent oxidoreductase-domain-containing protein n=1 Tax=Dunaliella salina TaxID=3046 RepID=A0ABQ7H1Q9_DUNSA|nr:FAD dependent oxidoreductase-domain-containing protein [Dunaliella salina]|eukprot:KAF5840792.1 FAD dependent oxidoreductase-domain-containing protein [Dunaliella salina]